MLYRCRQRFESSLSKTHSLHPYQEHSKDLVGLYGFPKLSSLCVIMKHRYATRSKDKAEHGGLGEESLRKEKRGKSWKDAFVIFRPSNDAHFNFIVTLACVDVMITLATEVTSPTAYGKFGTGTTFSVPPRIGWWLMELPVSVMLFYFFFIKGGFYNAWRVMAVGQSFVNKLIRE